MLDIKAKDGKLRIRVADTADARDDVVVLEDGKEVSYLEAVSAKEKKSKKPE